MTSVRLLNVFLTVLIVVVFSTISSFDFSKVAYATAVTEVEPNNDAATAQQFHALGTDSPITASISPANDQDWYSFTVVAQQSYVIEIYNASASVATAEGWQRCNQYYNRGLSLTLYDSTVTEIKSQCQPAGAGNVHNILEITPDLSGILYVRVIGGSGSVTGSYSIRVLPKYGNSSLTWNQVFEPNNRLANAYELKPGAANALQASIENRSESYSTNDADVDWYRFDAVAKQTYVVELFNVSTSVATAEGWKRCNQYYNRGLSLTIYDSTNTAIKSQCGPSGAGNVHNIVEVTPDFGGTLYIQVLTGSSSVFGNYSIRLLPKYSDAAAAWNATTYEPNNRAANAYALGIGTSKAISASIEERGASFSTNLADVDWYHFDAIAGQTYQVELFNVAPSLSSSEGQACSSAQYYSRGLGLTAYDASVTIIGEQCSPKGTGAVHNSLEIKPNVSGVLYIRVIPGSINVFGDYSLRIKGTADEQKVFIPFLSR